MRIRKNIYLTGFMGVGKTTVARVLSQRISVPYLDIDDIIQEREGNTISEIFRQKGEPYFRKMEKKILKEIAQEQGVVVATGGGTLLDKENVEICQKNGLVVLLWAEPEIIFERIKNDIHRPLLSGENKYQKIAQLLYKRKPQYERIGCPLDTSNLSIDQIVNQVLKLYQGE